MADKRTEVARTEPKGLARRAPAANPFRMLERFGDEMDRIFDEFGFGRGGLMPRLGFGWPRHLLGRTEGWLPDIEMLQRNHDLLIRADLPGLTKDDVKVEITENAVTIEGERRRAHEEEKGGVYRSERSYGRFSRVIALPEGAIIDQAKATYKDGVLEITMPAPPEAAAHGRTLEITEAPESKK